MKICPSCYDSNSSADTACKRCGANLSPSPKTCPSGRHVMDPVWIECVYCKAEASGGSRPEASNPSGAAAHPSTIFEQPPVPAGAGYTPVEAPRKTAIEQAPKPPVPSASGDSAARKTAFYSPGQEFGPRSGPAAPQPKIVGVLLTYSWNPEGQIFPVREGRNLIGRDPERCNIAIPQDNTLSAVNSHITFRRNFVLGDNISMSGTDLNELPVEEQFVPLPNYARIRTGSTHWIFVMLDPRSAGPQASPAANES